MSLSAQLVGAATPPITHTVDARWLMAYAAGVGCTSARYFDTTGPAGLVGHPLFPVCVEWPTVLALRHAYVDVGATIDEIRRGVHASHDLMVHRLIRDGDELVTTGTIVAVAARRAGTEVVVRLATTDAVGAPVATTFQSSVFLGVPLDGDDLAIDAPAPLPALGPPGPLVVTPVAIEAGAAHVYTECARIWNPIHTDVATAARAGLPGLILHGTATHAHAVNAVVDHHLGGNPDRLRRLTARFGAMVRMPSELEIETTDRGAAVAVTVRTADGGAALRDALAVID